MIFISDPERNKFPNAALLQQLYELTPSESKLVEALVKGYPVDKIGEIMGLREASVRTYIKRIMSKLGVTRQVEMVRMVMSLPEVINPE
ncbi:hypothetical protein BEN30_17585 [Magnetovibrio blakemorei]|uniref:HTH luxR-type domain-containing protein n=2 Tax=Magnetovibrio blakemorei TaxID=28181 RepID=A0A1E5Q2W2_9PROT|nr:hypothetical protein BEN30_17585 [Magnetovibrio blakemorei]